MKTLWKNKRQLGWLVVALLLLSHRFSRLTLAQEGVESTPPLEIATPEPETTPAPEFEDREALLRQAAQLTFTEKRPGGGNTFGPHASDSNFEVGALEIVEDWGLVTIRVQPSDPVEPARSYLALARWQENGWQVALEDMAEFGAWLQEAPEALLPAEARPYLGAGVSVAGALPELLLPFPAGQTWKYAQGPYGGPRREAIDFAPFSPYEPINFSPPGNRERIVTAAADGVVIDRYQNRLILRHFGGWETGYDSLAQASNILRVGQVVYAGQKVGLASDEIDSLRDPFVRFWVRHYSVEQIIDGLVLSGWRVIQDNSYQAGHGFGAMVFEGDVERVDCRSVYSYYLPLQSCHITHAPPSPALVRIWPEYIQINRGETALTTVEALDVTDAYSVSMLITYDADILSVGDADPIQAGVQIAPGNIFTSGAFTVTENFVGEDVIEIGGFERNVGFIFFKASRLAPEPAFTGSGALAGITWVGKNDGQTRLVFGDDLLENIFEEDLEVYNPSGLVISTKLKEGDIKVINLQPVLTVRGQIVRPGYYGSTGPLILKAGQPQQLGPDGHFEIVAEAGYELTLSAPGYLSAQVQAEAAGSEATTIELGAITLPGGDVNADNQIDIFDVAIISRHYGVQEAQADVTGDGTVNLMDLTLAAAHYGQQGPVLITAP